MDFDHHAADMGEHNIWETYAELRSRCPVAHSKSHGGFWILTRYEDVIAAARDHRTFSSANGVRVPEVGHSIPIDFDPPIHTAYRALFTSAFTPEKITGLGPLVRKTIKQLLGDLAEAKSADFVDTVAAPLPLRVLSELIGYSESTVSQFRELTQASFDEAATRPLHEARNPLRDLMAEEIAARRADPKPDYITTLLSAEIDGRPITDEELISTLTTFAIAGHETTVNALCNVAYLLGSSPDLQEQIRNDPAIIPRFVEESLRQHSPAHLFARTTTREVQVRDVVIPAGESVLLAYGSANRDEEKYPGGAEADVSRGARGHLAFGAGIHQCVGAPIARTELRILLEELRELPRIRLDGAPEYTGLEGGANLGFRRLPVRLGD
ncbi:cytochrome P450 [Nocardia sp. R6R-6]|uniref:cytochrome P450 n=1 Tax=Nocardia sp. R6R-6 TaxID=3459303 RepID=UPI00403DA5C1